MYHEPSGGTSRKLLLMIVLYYISRLYETSAVIEIPNWAMNESGTALDSFRVALWLI